MQKLLSYMRSACQQYDMIKDGDRIAVGVSDGKDSVALLAAMAVAGSVSSAPLVLTWKNNHFVEKISDLSFISYLIKKKINSRFFSFFSEFIHFLQITLKNKKWDYPQATPIYLIYIKDALLYRNNLYRVQACRNF